MKITLQRKTTYKDDLIFYMNKSNFEMVISSCDLDIDLYMNDEYEWFIEHAYYPDDDIIETISDNDFPTTIVVHWYNIEDMDEEVIKELIAILDQKYGIKVIIHSKTGFYSAEGTF